MASLGVRRAAGGGEGSCDEDEEDGSKDDEEAPEAALSFPVPLTGGSATKGGGKSVDDDVSGDERGEGAEGCGSFADFKAELDRDVIAIDGLGVPSLFDSLASLPAPLRPSPCVLLLLTTPAPVVSRFA